VFLKSTYFTHDELKCHCGCNTSAMDSNFLVKLDLLRSILDLPLIISSGYRCPAHNQKVSFTGQSGPHTTGKACDILCCFEKAYKVLYLAIILRFSGIGLAQKGDPGRRYIHIDTLAAPDHPRPRVWTY